MARMNWARAAQRDTIRTHGSESVAKLRESLKTQVKGKAKPKKGKVWVVCLRCRHAANVKPHPRKIYRCSKCNGVGRVRKYP